MQDASLWGLDPLYWTHLVLLNVHVVRGLIPNGTSWEEVNAQRALLKCNHALPNSHRVVAHAHLMGVLVRRTRSSQFTTYTIDDGTALVDCVSWNNAEEEFAFKEGEEKENAQIPLGSIIRCLGRLEWPSPRFQSSARVPARRLILNQTVALVRDVNQELRHWTMAMDLWDNVYTCAPLAPIPPASVATSRRRRASKFGGELEEEIMQIVCNAARMPLLCSGFGAEIQAKHTGIYPACFQSQCLAREQRVANILLVRGGGGGEEELHRALKTLCHAGHILVIDPKLDLFALITHAHFLAPAILAEMDRCPPYSFINRDALLSRLQQNPALCAVPHTRFDRSLSRLLDDNQLVEGGQLGTFARFREQLD